MQTLNRSLILANLHWLQFSVFPVDITKVEILIRNNMQINVDELEFHLSVTRGSAQSIGKSIWNKCKIFPKTTANAKFSP